jgi:hypothetical protein
LKLAREASSAIVNRDGVAAVLADDGEARHVRRAVADVDHVVERHRAQFGGHVVVHVLRKIEQAFIDAEEELRLLRVADDALGKGDAPFASSANSQPKIARTWREREPSMSTFSRWR